MTKRARPRRERSSPRQWRSFAGAIALVALGALAVSACGAAATPLKTQRQGASIRTSLATSIETLAGSWVTVPMGHLDQPLNTFWQLFFRPSGATAGWSNRASALAVATNGGLILASDGGKALAVGIRPTNDLDYSPLIVTSNARSWTPEAPIGGLVNRPDALAMNAAGGALALVSDGEAAQVLESPRDLAGWRTIVSESELSASQPGRLCGVASVTAVGYSGADELVGASCSRAGIVGIFTAPRGVWRPGTLRLVGPELPSSLGRSSSEVLGLQEWTGGLCALIELAPTGRTELVAACTSDGKTSWRISPALTVTGSDDVVSFGPTGTAGLFALISGSALRPTLAVLRGSDMRWDVLASPPARTATVVFAPTGRVDAFVVDDTLYADWRLDAAARRWKRSQQIQVAIQFGSSS